jgi:hypothetical protein
VQQGLIAPGRDGPLGEIHHWLDVLPLHRAG